MTLQTITISPASGKTPRAQIVLMHGWGANAQNVDDLANYLDLPDVQMVFPQAPFLHPYNPVGRMWYSISEDYSFLSDPEFRTTPEVSQSREALQALLAELPEKTGVPIERTILGGFSQGGAMTLDVGLDLPLAGLMVLSGYLHAPPMTTQSTFPPVVMVHGRQDPVVPIAAAHQTRDRLTQLGVPVTYQEFDMGHEISMSVLDQIQTFVERRFAN